VQVADGFTVQTVWKPHVIRLRAGCGRSHGPNRPQPARTRRRIPPSGPRRI